MGEHRHIPGASQKIFSPILDGLATPQQLPQLPTRSRLSLHLEEFARARYVWERFRHPSRLQGHLASPPLRQQNPLRILAPKRSLHGHVLTTRHRVNPSALDRHPVHRQQLQLTIRPTRARCPRHHRELLSFVHLSPRPQALPVAPHLNVPLSNDIQQPHVGPPRRECRLHIHILPLFEILERHTRIYALPIGGQTHQARIAFRRGRGSKTGARRNLRGRAQRSERKDPRPKNLIRKEARLRHTFIVTRGNGRNIHIILTHHVHIARGKGGTINHQGKERVAKGSLFRKHQF